jgi:hypothetical protein
VLDTLGGGHLELGRHLAYDAQAWERVRRGERPSGDELADAFFHLARIEELDAPRDEHGRFAAAASCLDPFDPPLERFRSPRAGAARASRSRSRTTWTCPGAGPGSVRAARPPG